MRYPMILMTVICLGLVHCDGNGSTSPTPTSPTPPPPTAEPASWLLTFVDVSVGIESVVPPQIFVEPVLRLQEKNGTSYRVNSMNFQIRITQRPDYLQQTRMNADEIRSEFGTNEFSGGGTEVFKPHFVVEPFPDGDLELVVIVAVADELGNSKMLRVSRIGDTASIRAFLKTLER